MKETNITKDIMLHAHESLSCLFRNNVGRLRNDRGEWVHYGLCVGSSDLIGYTTIRITPEMVGQDIAVFTAAEVKTATGQPAEQQKNFIKAVIRAGGIAGIARSRYDFAGLVEKWKKSRFNA